MIVAGCGTDRARGFVVPVLVSPSPNVTQEPPTPSAPASAGMAALPEGVPIPPKRPLDPSVALDDGPSLLLGSNKIEAWLHFEHVTVVVDKATGCATESYPEPVVLRLLKGASPERVPEMLERPDVLAALREHVGLARRFGLRTPGYSWVETALTPDGRIVYVATMGGIFRSNDGARTFRLVSVDGSLPRVSPDGKWLVYASRGRFVTQPADGSEGPADLTGGQTTFFDFDRESRARFTRSDSDVCLDTFTLDGSRPPVSVCVSVPSMLGPWSSRAFQSVSPNGAYGLVTWDENRTIRPGGRALSATVGVVDMKTSTIEKTLPDVRGKIDDQGNVVAEVMTAGGPDPTVFFRRGASKIPKRLGDDALCEWDGETAWLWRWEPSSTLGKRRCNLVKVVPTPP